MLLCQYLKERLLMDLSFHENRYWKYYKIRQNCYFSKKFVALFLFSQASSNRYQSFSTRCRKTLRLFSYIHVKKNYVQQWNADLKIWFAYFVTHFSIHQNFNVENNYLLLNVIVICDTMNAYIYTFIFCAKMKYILWALRCYKNSKKL